MQIILYITGILAGLFLLGMLRYINKYNTLKTKNTNLKYENEELSKFKKRYGFRKREGIIKKSFIRRSDKNKIDFIIEITEVEKTVDKSKIIINHISYLDPDENFDSIKDFLDIKRLTGEWISTSDIEWKIDKTKAEKRTTSIDNILKDVEKN